MNSPSVLNQKYYDTYVNDWLAGRLSDYWFWSWCRQVLKPSAKAEFDVEFWEEIAA